MPDPCKSTTRLSTVAFLFSLIVLLGITLPAHAAPRNTITVMNTNDSGAGSLRDAIASAVPSDTILFSLALPATIGLDSELAITQSLTISGPGSALLNISGLDKTRVISVTSGVELDLFQLTISHGSLHSSFTGNLYNLGMTNLSHVVFSDNFAFDGGGAIGNSGSLNVVSGTFTNNGTAWGCGAINNSGALTVANCEFSGNHSGYGTGTICSNGILTVTNSTFTNNGSSRNTAGISTSGTAVVMNSTFYNNYAGVIGAGGIANTGSLTVSHSTFSGNSGSIASSLYRGTLVNSLVANSQGGPNCFGVSNGGNNIDDGVTCGWGFANGSMTSRNPLLGPLQNNGGSTSTMAPLPGSPAIDGVTYNPPNGCPPTDQRGIARPIGARCDVGSFEAPVYPIQYFPVIWR